MARFQNFQDDSNIACKIEEMILNKLMENFKHGNPFVSIKTLREYTNKYNSIFFDKAIHNLTSNGIIYKAIGDNFQITRHGLVEYERRQQDDKLI